MHTSSSVDNIDEYAETIVEKDSAYFYRYGNEERPVTVSKITVPYRAESGMATREFTVYRTHHGPIVRKADGKWIAVRLMEEPLKALQQSYLRTKARDYNAFRQSMDLYTNSSNNTIYANADGDIVYFHANFIPRRDPKFDWTQPVDGRNPATEWGPLLTVEESPFVRNPATGWLYNTNNWPYSAADTNSPRRERFATYVDAGSENARGIHAIEVLKGKKDFTLDKLIAAAYDSRLPAFDVLLPPLIDSWDRTAASDSLNVRLAEQVDSLRRWDKRWAVTSVPTTLAVYWGEEMGRRVGQEARRTGVSVDQYVATRATPAQRLEALAAASDTLAAHFGSWKTPWGDVNRFQRLTGDIVQPFNDSGPSIPVAFTSARWGSLASFGARRYPGTKKMYGTSGNSFVAVVEFGDSVRAKAITAGGQSGDPRSPHFNDQAVRYSTGNLREVYFYRTQLEGHVKRQYHPGDAN